jgi:hypothetical protein
MKKDAESLGTTDRGSVRSENVHFISDSLMWSSAIGSNVAMGGTLQRSWTTSAAKPPFRVPDCCSASRDAEAIEAELRAASGKIERLGAVLAGGADAMPSIRSAVVALERAEHVCPTSCAPRAARGHTRDDRDVVITGLVSSLENVREVLNGGDPAERKAVVRNFLAEARVERQARRIVLSWYRVPRNSWMKLVAVGGIEPPTRGL